MDPVGCRRRESSPKLAQIFKKLVNKGLQFVQLDVEDVFYGAMHVINRKKILDTSIGFSSSSKGIETLATHLDTTCWFCGICLGQFFVCVCALRVHIEIL